MTTPDTSEKSVLRIMQREQERERRRIRDRQRRQSMTLEEREKHLARRRRNYQLRRQKADNSQLDSQQTSPMTGGDHNTRNGFQAATTATELGMQSGDSTYTEVDQGQDSLDVSSIRFEDLEGVNHILAKLPRKLRLSQVRHLARSLNDPMDELTSDSHLVGADFVAKENARAKFGGQDPCSQKRLRLNYVKRLARAVHIVKESAGHSYSTELEGTDLASVKRVSTSNNFVLPLMDEQTSHAYVKKAAF